MPDILVKMTDTQKFPIGPVTGFDSDGDTVPTTPPITVMTADTNLLTINDNGDGTWEALGIVHQTGTATIVVSDGSSPPVTQNIVCTITEGAAVSLNVPVGPPVEQ